MAGDLNLFVDLNTQQAANQVNKLWSDFKNGSQEAGAQLNKLLGGTVDKKVRIRLEKDTAGIKQVKAELVEVQSAVDGITKAYRLANKTQPGSLTNLRQQITEAKQAKDAISLFSREVDLLNRKQILGSNVNPEFVAAQRNVEVLTQKLRALELASGSVFDKFKSTLGIDQFLRFGQGVQDVVTIFQSLGIAISALTSPINQAANALARLQGLGLAFKAIGLGSTGANAALEESSRIALGLGVSLDTVRAGFQKLTPVITNSGGDLGDVSAILESLSSRFAAFGLNADESRRVLNGVIQAFAKGKLQAEELTQQISEADPAFKTDFANALFAAKDSLDDLGQEVDGTVANLEGLVKQGRITNEVLIKVLPGLSKSSVLFGKLGSSALDAVKSLKTQGTTITQVRTQLDNLNQLNLERFAKIFQPLIESFFEIQAGVTDFVTRISKLEIVGSLAALFSRLANSISNLVQFVLNGVEGFLRIADAIGKVFNAIGRVLGPIADFIGGLASAPGLLETIGVLLLARLVAPAKEAIATISGLTRTLVDIGKTGSIKIDIGSDLVNEFRSTADAIKKTFDTNGIASAIDNSIGKANTAAGARLKELREKFRNTASTLEKPIKIATPISPRRIGLSAKIIKEVQESKDSLSGLFSLKADLERQLGLLSDPAGRRSLFDQKVRTDIAEITKQLEELEIKRREIDDDELDLFTATDYENVEKRIKQLEFQLESLQDRLKNTNFTPKFDEASFKATKSLLQSVERDINRLQKVRSLDIRTSVDTTATSGAVKEVVGLRDLYSRKLELEAQLKVNSEIPGAARELEDIKRTIRSFESVDIPVNTNAVQVSQQISSSKNEIRNLTNDLILSEDGYYKALQRSVAEAEFAVKTEKERLNLSKQQLERSLSRTPEQQRTAYEEELSSLERLKSARDEYVRGQEKQITATSKASQIADDYSSKALTQTQALAALNSENTKYSTLQNTIQGAIAGTTGEISQLERKLKAAKQTLATSSFGSLGAEKAKADINSLNTELSNSRQKLSALQGIAASVDTELAAIGNTTKSISSAEFRLGEKIKTSVDSAVKSISGLASKTGTVIKGVRSGFDAIGNSIKGTFSGGIRGAISNLGNSFASLGGKIRAIGSVDFGKGISNSIRSAGTAVNTFARGVAANIPGAFANASRAVNTFAAGTLSRLRNLGSSFKGFAASIGIELAIFAAIATATAAYNKAVENTKRINEETTQSIDSLNNAVKESRANLDALQGVSSGTEITGINKEFTALEKILLSLGNALLQIQKGFEGFFNFLGGKGTSAVKKSSQSFVDWAGRVALAAGAGALLGGALTAWLGPGAAVGAVIGATVGAFVAAAASTEDWKVRLEEAKKEQEEIVNSAKRTAGAIKSAAVEIARQAQAARDLDAGATGAAEGQNFASFQAKGIQAYAEVSKSVNRLKADIQAFENASLATEEAISQATEKRAAAIAELNGLIEKAGNNPLGPTAEERERAGALRREIEQLNAEIEAGGAENKQYESTLAQLKIQQKAAELAAQELADALGISREELDRIRATSFAGLGEEINRLEEQIKALNFDRAGQIFNLGKQIGEIKAEQQALEDIANRGKLEGYYNRLRQLIGDGKIASSLGTLNDLISNLQAQIELLDFTKPEDLARIDELATQLGRVGAILEVVESRVESNRLAGYIEQIRLGLANGEIPNSLNTINNLVGALENRQLLLDIESPELREVTEQLIEAQQKADELNGKKATITLEVIQAGLLDGSIVNTLSIIDRQIEALNQKKLSLPVNSAGYVQVIEQIDDITRKRQLSEETTDDLLERKYNIQKERIDTIAALEKARSDQRISQIDREIDKVKTYYDKQIKGLEELGPAERELAALRKQELREKSGKGGKEGLEARAALERLEREEQIAVLKEKQAAEVARLEAKKKQEQDAILAKEEAVLEKRLQIEERIAALRLKSLAAEEADIDAILAERAGASGAAAGQAFGKSFADNSIRIIADSIPGADGGASPVQFNYDNTQVIAAQDEVIAKEQEYQRVLGETDALRQQIDSTPLGEEQSRLIDELMAKEQQRLEIEGQLYQSQESYNQALRDTADITGSVVITNQDLGESVQAVAEDVQQVSTGTGEAAQSFFDLNAATQGTAENVKDLSDKVTDVNKETQEIGRGAEEASGKFNDLSDSVGKTGDEASETKDIFGGAADKISKDLIPALEKVPVTLDAIQDKMNSIFDRDYTVNVKLNVSKQGLWTGGPATRGTAYTVNELGQEGFMNKFGKISPIRKAPYGTWRAPSDGFVIPAHIYSQLNATPTSAPDSRVRHVSPRTGSSGARSNGLKEMIRALGILGQNISRNNTNDMDEFNKVQAHQAKEIGKLSRAVQELSEKDWNVKVGVRSSGANTSRLSTYRI